MDSTENNQEVSQTFERAQTGSTEEAANKFLGMQESPDEQPADEGIDTTESEEEVVEEEEKDEVENEEVSEEEAESEVEEEDDSEEEVEEETDEEEVEAEEPSYTIKVDGEESEVSLEELKAGYQRQSDYTRKSQALAEGRKENEAIQTEREQLEQERQMYANGLEMLQEQQQSKLQEFDTVEWATLKEDDPYTYMIKKDEYRDAQEKVNNVAQQRDFVRQQEATRAQELQTEFVQRERASLETLLPEWFDSNSTIQADIEKFAISSGFAADEISQLADHRSVLILKKAMEFDRLSNKVTAKKKVVKKVPKVQKSGRGKVKAEATNDALKKQRTKLRKSGSTDDAASVFENFL